MVLVLVLMFFFVLVPVLAFVLAVFSHGAVS